MPAIINTNIASLNAQRNLNSSQSALQTSLQRLSSGLRINSAKDDAAGLAISERFSTQIRGLNQAARNANDGISLAQTGEGALAAVTDNLQRIRELAVQAANSTNSADDRAAIQLEVAQRLAEIDRTASQTSFNGQKLLDGSFQTANFQIGANAGEVIGIDLQTNARINSIGAIASTTSNVLGGTTTGGNIVTGAVTAADFSVTAQAATSGRITINPSTFNFGVAAAPLVAGYNAQAGATGAAYDFSGATAVDGVTDQAVVAGASGIQRNYVGAGNAAQFDVTDGAALTTTIALTTDFSASTLTQIAAEVQSQLTANGNGTTVSVVNGNFRFTDAGTTVAPIISGVDTNAGTAGFTASTGVAGVAAGAGSSAATFSIDGTAVTLNQAVTDLTTLRDGVQAAIDAAGALVGKYTASIDGTGLRITKTASATNPDTAAVISNANASALLNAGIVNSAGTAGSPAVTSTNASFTLNGIGTITLDQTFTSFDDMISNTTGTGGIQAQLDAFAANTYTATNVNGAITISKNATGLASTAIDISAVTGFATSAGIAVAAGTGGANLVAATNALVTVDGTQLSLTGANTNLTDVQTDLQAALDAAAPAGFGAGAYTVNISGTGLEILNNTAGSAAVSLTANNAAAVAAGFGTLDVPATGTAGIAGGTVTVAGLSINGTAITAQTYTSTAALATAINSSVAGVYASVVGGGTNGALSLSSASALTLAGADVTTLGLNGGVAGTVAANGGSLTTATVATTADANLTIQRIDAALNTVSNLRSTFGAVQNRFESVISSLSATSENLTAARSRIQDTDFAAETAQLTRNQILQQAGTAMLAQANQLPNTVLSLLR